MRFALIPMKELPRAKARLARVLDDARRRELALALFRDVLAAALACPPLDGVVAVTRDADLLALAAEAGAEGLPEPGALPASAGQALNEALTSAAQTLERRGADRLVVLAADLPLAEPDAVAAVIRADADVAVVPSGDGGTNALALPPGAIAFCFGPDSARRHLDAARAAGLRSRRLDLPALALDIDTPDDLARLRIAAEQGQPIGRNTLAALERLSLINPTVRGG